MQSITPHTPLNSSLFVISSVLDYGGPDRPVFPRRRGPRAQAFGYAGNASGGICCRRIKRPEENEGQDQNGADVKGEQAIEVLHCAI